MRTWSAYRWLLVALPVAQVILISVFSNLLTEKLSATIILGVFFLVTLGCSVFIWRQIETLRKMGITRLDATMKEGMEVLDCITRTSTSLSFLGVAGSKWYKESKAMDEMFQRIFLHK